MSVQALSLPDEVKAALQDHDDKKNAYLALRERLASLSKRVEKHRRTQAAAEHQSKTAGDTWRRLFRERDGELTKEIRDLKRQELDARELAEEYSNLAIELLPGLELCQIETYDAREKYLHSREQAFGLYGEHCLSTSTAALFALPEASAFLQALQRKKLIIKREVETDAFFREATFSDEQKAVSRERARRLGEVLYGYIEQANATLDVMENDPVWLSLESIARNGEEAVDEELKGVIFRNRRRSELQSLLGRQAQAQTA